MKKTILGKLLHVANSYPDCVDKERFYAMKYRILSEFATPDGYDIQHLPGKKCWTCDGTGIYVGYHFYSGDEWQDACNRCWGGWFKRPVWNVLDRYRLGGYVFHVPAMKLYEEPERLPQTVKTIEGYVRHCDYGYKWPAWACLVLGLVFDRQLALAAAEHIWQFSWPRQRWYRWRIRVQRRREERKAARVGMDVCDDVPF